MSMRDPDHLPVNPSLRSSGDDWEPMPETGFVDCLFCDDSRVDQLLGSGPCPHCTEQEKA